MQELQQCDHAWEMDLLGHRSYNQFIIVHDNYTNISCILISKNYSIKVYFKKILGSFQITNWGTQGKISGGSGGIALKKLAWATKTSGTIWPTVKGLEPILKELRQYQIILIVVAKNSRSFSNIITYLFWWKNSKFYKKLQN